MLKENELRCKTVATCKECMNHKATCGTATACKPAKKQLRNYNGIRFTSDGFDCALPVSIDSHSVCSFGCLYCFAPNLVQKREQHDREIGQLNINSLESIFSGKEGKTNEIFRKALRYNARNKNGYPAPIQLGALTDPLDNIERQQGWFLKFAELVKKYNQPVRISTKGNLFLEKEYLDAVRDKPHLFRVHFSIISADDDVLMQIDKRAPPTSERIQCMKNLEDIGVTTCLRFRPIIPGISDATVKHPYAWRDLLDMAADAGCRNLSYEVAFLPGMMTKDIKRKWKEIERISCKPLSKIYKSFGKVQACTRPAHTWTEQIMHAIHKHAKKRGMNIGVSDPCWKQLTDFGCCCAISPDDPVFGNWQRKNATEALLQAKNTGKLIGPDDVIPEWADVSLVHNLVNPGAGPQAAYIHRHVTWRDKLEEVWNEVEKERSPLNYFQGAVVPAKIENNQVFYKYVGLKRRKPKNTPFWTITGDSETLEE